MGSHALVDDTAGLPEGSLPVAPHSPAVVGGSVGAPVTALAVGNFALAEDVASVLRAMARWRELPDYIERFVTDAYEDWGDMTLQEFLAGSGLEARWRQDAADLARGHLKHLVHTEGFEEWLRGQFDPEAAPSSP